MRPNLVRFLTFGAILASWTYLSIFARQLGMSDAEIGFVVAFYSVSLFISSFVFGRASDKFGRRLFLLIGLLFSSLALFLQIFAYDFFTLLLARSFVGFCMGIYPAALVAYVHEKRKNLARFSAFGSLGWSLATVTGGMLAVYFTTRAVFLFSSVLVVIALVVALRMKFESHVSIDVPMFPIEIIRKNLLLYVSVLLRHTGAHMIWTFWPLYLQLLGADLFWIGVVQMINSMTQFIFMYAIVGRLSYVRSVAAGLLMSSVTFFIFTLAGDFWQILPMQVLLGISWSLLYVGGLRYLMDRNVERATASGLFDSVLSLSSIIGPFLATVVVAFGSYRTTMYFASVFAFASLFLFLLSRRQKSVFKI